MVQNKLSKNPYSTGYVPYHNGVRVDSCPYFVYDDTCISEKYCGVCSKIEDCGYKAIRYKSTSKGIKYDNGKPRIGEMIEDFGPELLEVCKVWEFGANKYGKSNWKEVENGFERYTNAMQRHYLKEKEQIVDDETDILHATHLAWNALARLHFVLEREKANGGK